jgi:hypothetical protein
LSKTHFLITVAALILFVSAHSAPAQELTRVYVEARFGTLHVPAGGFLNVGEGNHFNFGGLFSYRPSVEEDYFWNRFTGRLSLDGAGIGGEDLASGFRTRERLYLVNFAAGLDLVQSDRGALTVHGGGAVSRNRLVLQGFSQFGGSLGTGGYEDACSFYQDVCESKWNLLGNYGVAGRFSPIESWPFFFVGSDFTRFAGDKNQFVITTGIAF